MSRRNTRRPLIETKDQNEEEPKDQEELQELERGPSVWRIAKPENFTGGPREDVEEWLIRFNQIVTANSWQPRNKLRVVPAFLTGAAGRWWKRMVGTFDDWSIEEADAIGFEQEFLRKFIFPTKRAKWIDNYERVQQEKKTVEKYNDEFLRAKKRVDPNDEFPEKHIIRKYIRGLNKNIGTNVYSQDPVDLDQAMEYALRVLVGHELMKNSDINLLDEVEELRAQINLLKLGVNPHDLNRNEPDRKSTRLNSSH